MYERDGPFYQAVSSADTAEIGSKQGVILLACLLPSLLHHEANDDGDTTSLAPFGASRMEFELGGGGEFHVSFVFKYQLECLGFRRKSHSVSMKHGCA